MLKSFPILIQPEEATAGWCWWLAGRVRQHDDARPSRGGASDPDARPAMTARSFEQAGIAGGPLAAWPTERRNDRTLDIDALPTLTLLERLNDEDSTVAAAVRRALPDLAPVVDAADRALRAGGRVHYFGAGTSGRLAVLDAAELGPTFGLPAGVLVAHIAGGGPALTRAVESAEDDDASGAGDAAQVAAGDVVIGVSASGSAAYVAGALARARRAGAVTALFTANPHAPLAALADVVVCADTGPEAITGSTRLKAGTAEKMLLNSFSTALMVRDGRTYSNLMVRLTPVNAKLRARQVRLLGQASGAAETQCAAALAAADGDVRVALVALLSGADSATSRLALAKADGMVRAAIEWAAGLSGGAG
jgi:N-acetylmuramic acid 6-phosphate etherase